MLTFGVVDRSIREYMLFANRANTKISSFFLVRRVLLVYFTYTVKSAHVLASDTDPNDDGYGSQFRSSTKSDYPMILVACYAYLTARLIIFAYNFSQPRFWQMVHSKMVVSSFEKLIRVFTTK